VNRIIGPDIVLLLCVTNVGAVDFGVGGVGDIDADDELDDFDYWPVLAIGLNYAF